MGPRKHGERLLCLLAVLLSFSLKAAADTGSYTQLDWSSASFSGPVTPGQVGQVHTVGESWAVVSNELASGGEVGGCPDTLAVTCTPSWMSWSAGQATGPQDFAIASLGSNLIISISTTTGSASAYAARFGSIVSNDGTINISIPYFISLSGNGDPLSGGFTLVTLDLLTSSGQGLIDQAVIDINQQSGVTNYSQSGVISLDENNLSPGTYYFDVQEVGQVQFVPEPSTAGLLLVGLAGIVRLRAVKRLRTCVNAFLF
jgi:hypothetical protein